MIKVELSMTEWEFIRDAFADVACWHHGFAAAKPDYTPPPQLMELESFIGDVKRRIARLQRDADNNTA